MLITSLTHKTLPIPDRHYTSHADNTILWTIKRHWSQHDTLEQAIGTINTYLILKELPCQAQKSALRMLHLHTRDIPAETPSNCTLAIQDPPIPQVSDLCSLGVLLHHGGPSTAFIFQLTKHVRNLLVLPNVSDNNTQYSERMKFASSNRPCYLVASHTGRFILKLNTLKLETLVC